jgi:hypothetical protein
MQVEKLLKPIVEINIDLLVSAGVGITLVVKLKPVPTG